MGEQVNQTTLPDAQMAWQVQLRWFDSVGLLEVRMRWVAAASVLVATWFASTILKVELPTLPLYLIGLGMLVYNSLLRFYLERVLAFPSRLRSSGFDYAGLVEYYWRGVEREGAAEAERYDLFVRMQTILDWLAMILLVHFTGGVLSPLLFFFVFHLIIASVLLRRWESYAAATFAVVGVGILAMAEYWGLIPHFSLWVGTSILYESGLYVVGVLVFFTLSLYVTVFLTDTLTRSVRHKDEELIDTQQRLSTAYHQIQTLYDVTKTSSSTLNLDEVLDLMVQSAAEVMGVRAASILLVDDDWPLVDIAASHGLSEAYLSKGSLDIEQNPFLRDVVTTGQPTYVLDTSVEGSLQYRANMIAEGIVSLLCVPVFIKGTPKGMLCLYSSERAQFNESDAEFLTAVANASASAIDNARAYEALEDADRARSQFVRMLTHEFRSPLSAVQSMLGLMEQGIVGTLTEKQLELVGRTKRRIQHLLAMVADLLDMASGKMEMLRAEKTQVDLGSLVAQVMDDLRGSAEAKGLSYQLEVDGEAVHVQGHHEGLERALTNLVSNAVKYTQQGGEVRVRVWSRGNQVVVEVADTGIGIPEDALPRMFSEFYRAKNAKATDEEGTGLGLVITKDVIEKHGGRIGIESKEGKGSVFTVILPTG
jgi:signal transduction histidine kinase